MKKLFQKILRLIAKEENEESVLRQSAQALLEGLLTESWYMEGLTLRGINAALTELAKTVGAHATLGFRPDDPTVRVLFRTLEGTKVGLDFRKSKPEKLIFCHHSGFLLNYIPRDEEEWKTLLHQAAAK